MDVESHAIIQDVKLLQELLLDWKIWNKAEACDVYFYFICVSWESTYRIQFAYPDHFNFVVQKHYLYANVVQPSPIFTFIVFFIL